MMKKETTNMISRYDFRTKKKNKAAAFRARTTTRGGPWTPEKTALIILDFSINIKSYNTRSTQKVEFQW